MTITEFTAATLPANALAIDGTLPCPTPCQGTPDPALLPPVPIVPAGTRLASGEVYLNLACPGLGPFRALVGQIAGSRDRYVARAVTTAAQWHALIVACALTATDRDEELR